MERRTFLKVAGATAGSAVVAGALGATLSGSSGPPAARRKRAPKPRAARPASVHEVDGLPVADWVVEENRRPGTLSWVIAPPPGPPGALPPWPAALEGFADQVSYVHGEEVGLYVSTSAARVRAEVYRMGYYQGHGARLVAVSPEFPGRLQPAPTPVPGLNTIECRWKRSVSLAVGADWMPGEYLVKLVGSGGESHYVPLTVRDDASTASIVVQSSVTTWQAYNLWGGYSLYGGAPTGALADRSRVVSFDRPYRNPDASGSADFLGNEFPFVYLAERHGLDVTYWTDVDLHARPQLLANHRCLVSLGHDEYWSWQMRFDGAADHLVRGCNLVFLGANACYRQIRLERSPLGVDRRVVCYKDAAADPIARSDPRLATGASWATDLPGYQFPESELIGIMYQAYGANSPFVVVDGSSWVFAGTGLRDGDSIAVPSGSRQLVGSEFDGFEPSLPGPRNVQILGHTPVTSVGGALHSDASYYTHPSGGGVFATGTASWVPMLWDGAPALAAALRFARVPVAPMLARITLNVLGALGSGPGSLHRPSVENWRQFYAASAAAVPSVDA
ncbi:MAG: hypothetical protein M0Z33_01770 [Actinomycetota bacterium]|nr:hypothetical protein [Actinomycetota bacterium]